MRSEIIFPSSKFSQFPSLFSQHLDQSLLNIDPRYSATYGNPYLKQHSPLIITNNTANPALTPAPPPYMSTTSRGSNSNSSFSSSTTISNVNGGGSIVGIGTTLAGSSIPSQTPSPSSGQFIVPANSKVGGLATHVWKF